MHTKDKTFFTVHDADALAKSCSTSQQNVVSPTLPLSFYREQFLRRLIPPASCVAKIINNKINSKGMPHSFD